MAGAMPITNFTQSIQLTQQLSGRDSVSASQDPLRQKAVELEGVFLNTLMSQMMSGLDSRGEFGGGYAEETWRGLQGEQLANSMARNGGLGLAAEIYRNLLSMQGKQAPATFNQAAGAYAQQSRNTMEL